MVFSWPILYHLGRSGYDVSSSGVEYFGHNGPSYINNSWICLSILANCVFYPFFCNWLKFSERKFKLSYSLHAIKLIWNYFNPWIHFNAFLIARSIQLENGGFSSPSTECKNLLYLLDMSSKVYKLNFLDKIDKKNW